MVSLKKIILISLLSELFILPIFPINRIDMYYGGLHYVDDFLILNPTDSTFFFSESYPPKGNYCIDYGFYKMNRDTMFVYPQCGIVVMKDSTLVKKMNSFSTRYATIKDGNVQTKPIYCRVFIKERKGIEDITTDCYFPNDNSAFGVYELKEMSKMKRCVGQKNMSELAEMYANREQNIFFFLNHSDNTFTYYDTHKSSIKVGLFDFFNDTLTLATCHITRREDEMYVCNYQGADRTLDTTWLSVSSNQMSMEKPVFVQKKQSIEECEVPCRNVVFDEQRVAKLNRVKIKQSRKEKGLLRLRTLFK